MKAELNKKIDDELYHELAQFNEVQGSRDEVEVFFEHEGIIYEINFEVTWIDTPPTKDCDGMRLYQCEAIGAELTDKVTGFWVSGEYGDAPNVGTEHAYQLYSDTIKTLTELWEQIGNYKYSEI